MKTLTTMITVVNNVTNIKKWQVTNFRDNDSAATPYATIDITIIGNGTVPYPPPSGAYTIVVFDALPSTTLVVNAASTQMTDQIVASSAIFTGAYTACCAAFYGANKNAGRLALEAYLLSSGILGSAFAGT